MKKVISIFLATTLVFTNFQGWDYLKQVDLFKKLDLFQGLEGSFAETGTLLEGTGIYYTISNNEVSITDADSSVSSELVIPETIEGYPVTSIRNNAFYNCSNITSVSIPDSVTTIGDAAFEFSKNLISINIPDSVTSIGKYAFSGCTSLKSINIPDGVTTMGNGVFSKCNALESANIPKGITTIGYKTFDRCTSLKSITIPDNITSIGESAFERCTSLTSIIIPDSVTTIGNMAFFYCEGLKNLSISENVTSIGSNAFGSCSNLTSITIPKSVSTIGNGNFSGCNNLQNIYVSDENNYFTDIDGVLFSKNLSTLLAYPLGKSEPNYSIPNGVKNIEKNVFYKCNNLVSVDIPEGVTDIGNGAFEKCENLIDVNMPISMESIGDDAFSGCTNLKNINIPNGVTSINYDTFYECSSLESIIIPETVTFIDSGAFDSCSSLKSIIIPEEVTSIDEYAFYGCDNLTIYGYAGSYAETYANDNGIPFEEIKQKVNITFDLNNGQASIVKEIEKDTALDYTPETPTREGYVFIGWYKNINDLATKYKSGSTYSENTTYTAKWVSADYVAKVDNLIITEENYEAVGFKWNKVENVDGYEVFRYTSQDGEYKKITTTKSDTYKDKDIQVGCTYYYKVRAYTVVDEIYIYGDFSDTIKSTPMISSSVVTAVPTSYNKNKVTWTSVPGADGYEVYRATSENGTYSLRKTVTGDGARSYINTSLSTGKTYYYKVVAYKIVNGNKVYGEFSKLVSATPVLSTPTATAVPRTYNSNRVEWTSVPGASGYEVYRATSENGTYSLRKTVTSGSSLVYTNTSLATGKTYYYKVIAYRTVNGNKVYGEFSEIVSATPVLSTPTATATSRSYSSNRVEWTSVSGAHGYEVYRATSENGTYSLRKTVASGSSLVYTNTSLTTGKTYYYKVVAYRIVNGNKVYGKFSEVVSATPVPAKPTVTLTSTSRKITVKWGKISGASGYEVYRAKSKYGTYSLRKTVTSGSTLTYTNTGLTTGKTYYYKVRAYRTVNGVKIYGDYSSVKYIKCK